MKILLQMIGLTFALLLLGSWLPGGTWWLTPMASAVLVALAFFGRQSPAVLLSLFNREWRGVGQLAWAHFGARMARLTLLALPAWLAQSELHFGGRFFSQEIAILPSDNLPQEANYAVFGAPTTVWSEPLTTPNSDRDSVRIHIETARELRSLWAQAQNDNGQFGYAPAARVGWTWTNLDLLPDLQITLQRPLSLKHEAAVKTLYISPASTTIRERSILAEYVWGGFFLLYPLLALGVAGWAVAQVGGWLHRQGRVSSSSPTNS
jgi:hypothetical protein